MDQARNIVRGYFSAAPGSGVEEKEDETLLDSIYRRIEDPLETGVVIDESKSEIREFYRDKVVLLTGPTGSVGVCVVEKLLRSCPIRKLYILVRPKRGKTVEERVERIFADVFFEEMKSTTTDWRDKVVPVEADMSAEGLGISSGDRSMLIEDTNVIIHLAANVKFNENLGKILRTNVLGTCELMDIAQECRNLRCFLYVSTAYSQYLKGTVREEFYEPPVSLEYARELASRDPECFTEEFTRAIIRPFPNTYSFSKAIAEDAVRQRSKRLTACVVRPSICAPIYREPLRGWTNSIGGMNMAGALGGLGVVRVACGKHETKMDTVPTDYVSNALIAAAWDADASCAGEPLVYNVTQSHGKLTSWYDMIMYTYHRILADPTVKAVWYPNHYTVSNTIVFRVLDFFFHFLPALLVDLWLLCNGKKRRTLSLHRKGLEYMLLTLFYMANSWRFETTRTNALWRRLDTADRALFPFERDSLSYDLWGYVGWRGLRVYILKDPMTTIGAARARMFKLKILHRVVVTIFMAVVTYGFFKATVNAFGDVWSQQDPANAYSAREW